MIVERFLAERERWILWAPVAVGAGIALYFSLTFEPPVFLGVMLLLLLGAFYWPLAGRKPLLILWGALLLFALGFSAAQLRTWAVTDPMLERETYPLTVEGKVVEVDALPKAYRVVLDDISITAKWPPKVIPERVRVKLKNNDPAVPEAGDIIRVKAVLLPLSSPVLPGAFDFQRHAFFKQLGATGYAIGNLEVILPHEQGFFFEKIRHAIRTGIERSIENKDTAAIVTAFLIGESKGISEDTWETIRQAGIAHLLAISGFHITVLAAFAFFGIRALLALSPTLALRYPIKKISALFAMSVAVSYTLLIGSPVPAERAAIMCCVVMLAIIIDRDPFTLRLAAFSAMLILLLQPETLAGPSFQLSFAAVVALIAFYESIRGWWSKTSEDRSWSRRYSLYVFSCFITTVVASLATAPYALYHFTRVPFLSGLFANMIAVPVSSFVTFPFGILACFLMPFGLEQWPLVVTGKSIDLIMVTAVEASSWQHALVHTDGWPTWILAMITLGGLWLCLWRGRMRYLGVLPIAAGLLCIPLTPRPDAFMADNGKLFAVRDDDGVLWISSARSEKFVRDEWIEREGGAGVRYPDDKDEAAFLKCDLFACAAEVRGRRIAFVFKPEVLAAECAEAEIVFAPEIKTPREFCKNKQFVFGKYDLRDDGAHAVYVEEENVRIVTAKDLRGRRPWTGPDKRPFVPAKAALSADLEFSKPSK